LGAVGGSVALRAAEHGVTRIVGYDAQTKEGVAAVRAGAVTELVHDPVRVVEGSDLVVIAVAPRPTLSVLERVSGSLVQRGVYCTDTLPIKRQVVRRAQELGLAPVFAGSHLFMPFAGPAFRQASPQLPERAVVYVTPLTDGSTAAAEIGDFWKRVIGAQPVTLAAEVHDASLAWTSHLPRAVAAALAFALSRGGPSGVTYGTAALDATRSATGPVDPWVDVLLANRDNLAASLDGLTASVTTLRRALMEGDRRGVEAWLVEAASWRGRFES
jgi:prephenate dehydrogenase